MRTLLLLLTLGLAALAQAAPLTFTLDPSASQARFLIGESLLGRENTAIGATNAVTGGVTLDGADPDAVKFDEFRVDAATLTTDDSRRDGQLRNNILRTNGEGRYVTFLPTSAAGLALPLVPGSQQSVQLTGDLTIKGVTRTAVFDLVLDVVSETELTGTASTVVKFADYGVSVPRVPLVARVDDVVRLELTFRLLAAE